MINKKNNSKPLLKRDTHTHLTFLPAQLTLFHEAHQDLKSNHLTATTEQQPESLIPLTPWKLYIDGASRGNPGPGGAGVYIMQGDDVLFKEGFYLGKKTNNQAEYLALALGIFFIKKLLVKLNRVKAPLIHVYSDSELLIKQMQGIYKVRNQDLLTLKHYLEGQLQNVSCRFNHIRREFNKQADALANEGIDKRKKLPTPFIKLIQNVLASSTP